MATDPRVPAGVVDAKVVACSIHTGIFAHRPQPRTTELHHIIPQAWQEIWRPPDAPVRRLWDPRTTPLCPTGHRNVHWLIVELMKGVAMEPEELDERTRVAHAIRANFSRVDEFAVARLALERFVEAGGWLSLLISAGQMGQA